MLAQYLALKEEAGDALLFYRMGDFYELFFEDAPVAAQCLGIALTRRGRHEGRDIPMCGVPVHAADAYLARLVRAGHRVAIAEQTEDPAAARKANRPVARAIVRVVTAATLTEEALLDARAANWLAVVAPAGARAGLAWADVSTGRFHCAVCDAGALGAELARLAPAELVAPEGWTDAPPGAPAPSPLAAMHFRPAAAAARLKALFGVASLAGFGLADEAEPEVAAAGALVAYLDLTARAALPRLDPPSPDAPGGRMLIDAATRASLELARSAGGARAGSLLGAIDRTLTAPGARRMSADLGAPLTDPRAIAARLNAVQWLVEGGDVRARVRVALKETPDLERALGRLGAGRGDPRDLAQLRDALARAAALAGALAQAGPPPLLAEAAHALAAEPALGPRLRAALVEEPGAEAFVAPGFDADLDAARADAGDGRSLLVAHEAELRAATGIAALRVRHNGVLGWHVEAPARYEAALRGSGLVHRQTLAGSVRFAGPELAALAERVESAGARAQALEAAHFAALSAEALAAAPALRRVADALARLDVSASHAELAAREGWTRPIVDDSRAFAVEAGRHPVVEAALRAARAPFVPNGVDLGPATRLWLVTGPNMGGKSTFLRQAAMIAALAQAGSFVPARRAHVGIVDRLFSRVGASDDLASGRSTFMVEMTETAAILRQATERSLVILDEVGRGTSTWDGLAIAWAVVEHVHDRIGCRCLFATHYHELTRLAGRLDALRLATMRAREWRGALVFLHEAAEGAAESSYGLSVARLAGVPDAVVARARAVLARLEASRPRLELEADLPLFAAAGAAAADAPPPDPLRARLMALDPDALSPREAHALLDELKALAGAAPG
jgi:DNA mismatch repair protein MutS